MKTITVRSPGCGGDNFTAFRNSLNRTGQELAGGESIRIEFDPAEFPFSAVVLESLLRGAGLKRSLEDPGAEPGVLVVERAEG